MNIHWPWDNPKVAEPLNEERNVVELEKEALTRDLEQVKLVNDHVLLRAVATGWIDADVAESIRSIQVDGESKLT